jgi:putative FmdB family regulatory protein
MPIYEYQCESCGTIVENWQKISDPPLETCSSCGGKMKKLISQSSFHLKGSGWYVTDYAGGKRKEKAKKTKDSSDKKSPAETKVTDNK